MKYLALALALAVTDCAAVPPTVCCSAVPAATTFRAVVAADKPSLADPDPRRVPSGLYVIDPDHTEVLFRIMHLGITPYYGIFSGASGRLLVNRDAASADTISVTLPVTSLYTPSAPLTRALLSAQWLNASAFPTMQFQSSSVALRTPAGAEVNGVLTLHGVTRPITFRVSFNASGINPIDSLRNVGFTAVSSIRRSDFGIDRAIPLVGDTVELQIVAAFKARY